MSLLRNAVLGVATGRLASWALRPTMRGHATIFMLHRFRHPETGVEGMDPAVVRRALARLRRDRYLLLPLSELFERLAEGRPVDRAVGFTIDDGYLDHALVAAPVFAEFDCPVTTFLCTGFLDRRLWFWWDRIEYIFRRSPRREVVVELGGRTLLGEWTDERGRRAVQHEFIERCKRIPDAEKHAAIARLADVAEVALPEAAPAEYGPMSWDQARACESRGMSFGPHTVTHPILSQTPDAQSAEELGGSWQRLSAEVRAPVPVFCYPNGGPEDFGPREIATLRALGLTGAVVGTPGYAGSREFRAGPSEPFLVRRFALPPAIPVMLQYASGFERLKDRLRGGSSDA